MTSTPVDVEQDESDATFHDLARGRASQAAVGVDTSTRPCALTARLSDYGAPPPEGT